MSATERTIQWWPVTDAEMRPPTTRVLVAAGETVGVARWARKSRRWVFPSSALSFEPTHWAHMPKGPDL